MSHWAAVSQRYLVVGLGNPGPRYDQTPHNMGADSVALLAAQLGVKLNKRSQQALWNTARLSAMAAGETADRESALILHLARPAMYMNECGRSVRSLVAARNVELSRLLVVWDHMDLPLGQLRFRPAGGPGGHNGMRSVINHLGTQQFPRLAVGVGRPPGRMVPAEYVLHRFSKAELTELVVPLRVRVGEAVVYWLRHGMEAAMNHFNCKP